MKNTSWIPQSVDISKPSAARVYDYHLGGSHNFASDRELGEKVAQIMPDLPRIMRANRDFLRKSIQYLCAQGITQFLDLGSGIPTVGNVHEVAHRINPQARICYVDIDAVAVAHARAMLVDEPKVSVIHSDMCDTETIVNHPDTLSVIDFSQPVGLLIVSVLQFVPDSQHPYEAVRKYREAIAAGSYFVLSHAAAPELDNAPEGLTAAAHIYNQNGVQVQLRTRSQVAEFFGDFEMVEPGIMYVSQWPDGDSPNAEPAERLSQLVGVAHKL